MIRGAFCNVSRSCNREIGAGFGYFVWAEADDGQNVV